MLGALAEARLPAMPECLSLLLWVVTTPVQIPSPLPPLRFDRRRRPGVPPLLLLSCNTDSGWSVCRGLGLTDAIPQAAQTVSSRLFALFDG
jgi:hypothetical protein